MEISDDPDPFGRLAAAANIEVVGFEPVEAELSKLRKSGTVGRTYLPYVIGDGQRHTFHECNYPMTSSIYPPNMPLLERFQTLADLTRVIKTTEVQTIRLDDIPECVGADLIKVDTQGAELMILRGGEGLLRHAQIVQVEVEFLQMYEGQPLFADLDIYLRSQGFQFHKFSSIMGRALKPIIANGNLHAPLSQAMWSDAVYVKDFMRFAALSAAAAGGPF